MRLIAPILAVFVLGVSPAPSPVTTAPPDPAARILAVRSSLSIANGHLAGPGARVLGDAAARAHFVLLGEDHGTREIPAFADAFFTSLVPLGYRTIAVETGPVVTQRLRSWIAAPDGRAQYAAFEKNHGGTTAFYGWEDEFAFLEHADRATGGTLRLWGLDQELMGSSKYLLESMLEQHPGARSTALIQQMLHEDEADYRNAERSGDPTSMFVMQVAPEKLSALAASLRIDGNARANALVRALIETRDIYINCCNEMAARSNRDRALLMKQTLAAYVQAVGTHAEPPKIFFKFGEEHLYRGLNPIRNLDLGNFVFEMGDGLDLSDLHVLALGAAGRQSTFAGIGKPWASSAYALDDADHERFHFLAPFLANMASTGWTLYDLRPLRTHFAQAGIADEGYERLVFGYDFLLLVPQTTADPAINPDVF
jgi:hypothetical protein